MSLQPIVHYGIHFLVPLAIAWIWFRSKWWYVYGIFIATMAIDLDHLLATPIFDPQRCSINFHPLHSYAAIGIYTAFLLFKKTRILGIGLLIHILADAVDCLFMQS